MHLLKTLAVAPRSIVWAIQLFLFCMFYFAYEPQCYFYSCSYLFFNPYAYHYEALYFIYEM